MAWCEVCNRSFTTENGLQMHLRDASVHAGAQKCGICGKSFRSSEALQMHSRDAQGHSDAQGHTQSYSCGLCNRTFTSNEALRMHIRDSPTHNSLPGTPLNQFFQSFPRFSYNPNLPPPESYAQLQKFYGWRYDSPESKEAWDRYQKALREEFNMWFGSEEDLGSWHALCRAVRISPLPSTRLGCERAVRGVYVNIVDLIEWARQGARPGQASVRRFKNLDELRRYTKETKKVFRNDLTDSDGRNIVLRHLLRFISRVS